MTYRAHVDKDVCISSGKCVADAPRGVRRSTTTRSPRPIDGHPGLTDAGLVDLARTCPSGAIHVHDADGVEIEVF